MIIHVIGISKTAASPTNIPPTTQHIGAQKYYVFHYIYYYMYTCTCTIGTSVIMLVTPTSVSGMYIVK